MLGVLLGNLGSPKSSSLKDVRKYLREFLGDPYVIDFPWLLRKLIIELIVVPFSSKRSAHSYASIWTPQGSPLIVNSTLTAQALEKKMSIPVAVGMRYQTPSLRDGIQQLLDRGVTQIIFIPQYPHQSMSTTDTMVKKFAEEFQYLGVLPSQARITRAFFDHELYIQSLAAKIQQAQKQYSWDHLLFSYHGVPGRHIHKPHKSFGHSHLTLQDCLEEDSPCWSYCYLHQVNCTTRLVAQQLNINQSEYSISYQSQLNRSWLAPFTDEQVKQLGKKGVKRLAVISPSFVSDCIETLEEINIALRKTFLDAGGKEFFYIPCVNDSKEYVQMLQDLVTKEKAFV